MEKTKTESLLEQARAICQRVTDREDVSDDLLRVVFLRLDDEADEAALEIRAAMSDAVGETQH